MKRKNTTRSALFTSIMSLLLCVSMLVGTTFAWFTDSVVSGVNNIAAGNLDVELYHSDKDDKDEKVTSTLKLFDDVTLWEPGVVAYENFVVANEGNLALKYQLSINFENETKVNGHGLSEALKVAVVEDGFTGGREDAHKLTNLVPLNSFVLTGELEGEEKSNTYGIVIYWEPTENDNWFNMNNENQDKTLTIDLGINLFATQEMYEKDSFGDDYDEDAVYTDFVVTDEEELKAALAEAEDHAVIGIEGNVTWTTGASHGSTPFIENATTYSLKPAVKNITLLGLDETATFTAIGSGVGPIGIDGGTVTFKNLKIVDESVSYNEGSWEFGYLEFRGNTVFEDCNVVNAIMMEGDSATFINCCLNSNDDNQYAVWVANGNATFENCYITGARGLKMHEAYGTEVGTVIINNNQFADLTKKPGLAIGTVNADTAVVLTNNTFAGTQAGDQGMYSYETDTDVTIFSFTNKDNIVAGYADTNQELKDQLQNNATVVIPEGEYTLPSMADKEGLTIIGAADGSTVIGGEDASTGFASNFGKNTTIQNVTFSGASNGVRWSYANGGISTFDNCTFAGDSVYGFHIDSSNGATFIFNNCTFSGFNAFAGDLKKVVFNNCTFLNNGNYGHTNIWSVGEFNNCTWGADTSVSPAGEGKLYFDGVEESFHHEYIGTVKGLRNFRNAVDKGEIDKTNKYYLVNDIDLGGNFWYPIKGAFNATFDGQGYSIKNMDLAHEYVSSLSNVGFFTKLSTTAVIKNVTFDNANVYGEHYVGVILGWEGNETTNATIDNCHVINSTVTCNTDANNDNGDKAGGICGYAVTLNITNCTVKDTTIKAYRDFGGILGCSNGSKVNVTGNTVENVTLEIDNDVNYKNYTTDAEHNAAPIVGRVNAGNVADNTVK